MLGYLDHDDTSGHPAPLAGLADRLQARGLRLAGAVQMNTPTDSGCDIDLRLLGCDHPAVRITQSLGPGAAACRLDTGALERAVGLSTAAMERCDLLVVNKFGKVEAAGGGFRQLIGLAMTRGIPVLTAVAASMHPAFAAFAGDMAQHLEADDAEGWCLAAIRDAQAA